MANGAASGRSLLGIKFDGTIGLGSLFAIAAIGITSYVTIQINGNRLTDLSSSVTALEKKQDESVTKLNEMTANYKVEDNNIANDKQDIRTVQSDVRQLSDRTNLNSNSIVKMVSDFAHMAEDLGNIHSDVNALRQSAQDQAPLRTPRNIR